MSIASLRGIIGISFDLMLAIPGFDPDHRLFSKVSKEKAEWLSASIRLIHDNVVWRPGWESAKCLYEADTRGVGCWCWRGGLGICQVPV